MSVSPVFLQVKPAARSHYRAPVSAFSSIKLDLSLTGGNSISGHGLLLNKQYSWEYSSCKNRYNGRAVLKGLNRGFMALRTRVASLNSASQYHFSDDGSCAVHSCLEREYSEKVYRALVL